MTAFPPAGMTSPGSTNLYSTRPSQGLLRIASAMSVLTFSTLAAASSIAASALVICLGCLPDRLRGLFLCHTGIQFLLRNRVLFRELQRTFEVFLPQRVLGLALLGDCHGDVAILLGPALPSLSLVEYRTKHGRVHLDEHLPRFNHVAFLDQHRLDAARLFGRHIHFGRLDAPISRSKPRRKLFNLQASPQHKSAARQQEESSANEVLGAVRHFHAPFLFRASGREFDIPHSQSRVLRPCGQRCKETRTGVLGECPQLFEGIVFSDLASRRQRSLLLQEAEHGEPLSDAPETTRRRRPIRNGPLFPPLECHPDALGTFDFFRRGV